MTKLSATLVLAFLTLTLAAEVRAGCVLSDDCYASEIIRLNLETEEILRPDRERTKRIRERAERERVRQDRRRLEQIERRLGRIERTIQSER